MFQWSPQKFIFGKQSLSCENIGYTYGGTRLNFVSKSRLAKTVLNVSDISQGKEFIKSLCDVLTLDYDESLITVTTPNLRPSNTMRNTSIGDWKPRTRFRVVGFYKVHRACLFVNGMEKPLDLLREDEG